MLVTTGRKELVMKSTLVIAAVIGVLAAPTLAATQPAGEQRPASVFYGHIKAMSATKTGYTIRFDPAWWLTGRAAEQAAFEDTGSRDVPNDYYVVDEGHRLLTFAVPRSADVTLLVGGGAQHARISAAELNAIENGKNPRHRRLSEPKAGFWIQVGDRYPNPAVRLFQQYQP
jgi:hypothetical protein